MPQIPGYGDSILPQGSIQAQASPSDFGAQVGVGMEQLGAAGAEVGDAVFRVEQDQGRIWAFNAYQKAKIELQSNFDKSVDALDPTDPGFTDKSKALFGGVQKQVDDTTSKLLEAAPSRSARRLIASHMATAAIELNQHADTVQAHISGQMSAQQMDDTLKASQDSVAGNYSNENFAKTSADISHLIGGMESVSPDVKLKWINGAVHGLAVTQVQAMFSKEPARALQLVNASGGKTNGKGAVPGDPNAVPAPPTPSGAPPLPPDHGASLVKPYDAAGIQGLSKRIDTASPYDAMFTAAGAKYGVDPKELKLRAVVESGLNPKATSAQGAGGLMQFTADTAAGLGIDRNDPAQAIDGAARLLAKYQKQAGGDQSVVDKLYYGGSDQSKWGANTQQYADNLAALRAATGGVQKLAPVLQDLPQVQPLTDQDIAAAKPEGIAGWSKLTWAEKVQAVRQAEGVMGSQLATDRGLLTQQIRDLKVSNQAGLEYPGSTDPRFGEANLTRLFGAVGGPRLASEVQYSNTVGDFMRHVQTMPVAQVESYLATLRPQGGAGTADQMPMFQAAQEAFMRVNALRSKDYMDWAVSRGLPGAKPFDFSNIQASLQGRQAVANTGVTDYQTPSHLLSEGEASSLSDLMNRQSPHDQMSTLMALKKGSGDYFSDVLSQVAPKAPALAFAASTADNTGKVSTTAGDQSSADVAQRILEGAYILKGKDPDDPAHGGRAIKMDFDKFRQAFWTAVGTDAFAGPDPERSNRAASDTMQAAMNYLAADLYHQHQDPSAFTQDQVANAVKAVTGGTTKSPAGDTLFVPWGMDESWFQKQFPNAVHQAVAAAGLTGSKFDAPEAFKYLNVDEGRYMATNAKGQVIRGANGQPLIVDMRGLPKTPPPPAPYDPSKFPSLPSGPF